MSEALNGRFASAADSVEKAVERLDAARVVPDGQCHRASRRWSAVWKPGAAAAPLAGPLVPGPQIYQSIGVEPVINCRGTFTIIGGSVERPEVRAAMDAAVQILRADRRTGRCRRPASRRVDRRRVGHGLGWLRRRTEARHRRLRGRRQPGEAHSHSRSDRSGQDRSRRPRGPRATPTITPSATSA